MPRDLPVGNSRLLVCFDQDYNIRELYFPHMEDWIGRLYLQTCDRIYGTCEVK